MPHIRINVLPPIYLFVEGVLGPSPLELYIIFIAPPLKFFAPIMVSVEAEYDLNGLFVLAFHLLIYRLIYFLSEKLVHVIGGIININLTDVIEFVLP